MHSGPNRRRFLRRLQPEVHASFLRRLLFPGAEPARMPLPQRLLFDCRRICSAGPSAASPTPSCAGNEGRTIGGRSYGGRRRMNTNPPLTRGLTAIDGAMVLIVVSPRVRGG